MEVKNYQGSISVNALVQLFCYLATLEVRILFSCRDWVIEALFFLMITCQRNGFQVLRKALLVLGDTFISQKDRGKIHNSKPFLVNAQRKGGQGPSLRC